MKRVYRAQTAGDGEMEIRDEFLTTDDVAESRARAELLANGFTTKTVSFDTFRTPPDPSMQMLVDGSPYVVTHVNIKYQPGRVVSTVTGERYDG